MNKWIANILIVLKSLIIRDRISDKNDMHSNKIGKYNDRIETLNKTRKDITLNPLNVKPINIYKKGKCHYNRYIAETKLEITSLEKIKIKRIQNELQRIRSIEDKVEQVLKQAEQTIGQKKLSDSENYYNKACNLLSTICSSNLEHRCKSIGSQITQLRSVIEQEEASKKAKEARLNLEKKVCKLFEDAENHITAENILQVNSVISEIESDRYILTENIFSLRYIELKAKRDELARLIKEREQSRERQEELRAKELLRLKEEELRRVKEKQTKINALYNTPKDDKNAIAELFAMKRVLYLYHFTSKSNIESIIKHGGLWSWYYCDNNKITIPNQGGNETSRSLDRCHGLEDYVRLSFCKDHPMAYRKRDEGLVLLKIKIDVAYLLTTKFSDMNATDNHHRIGDSCEFIENNIDFEAVNNQFAKSGTIELKKKQAEIMVKTHIPVEYIVNINCPQKMCF